MLFIFALFMSSIVIAGLSFLVLGSFTLLATLFMTPFAYIGKKLVSMKNKRIESIPIPLEASNVLIFDRNRVLKNKAYKVAPGSVTVRMDNENNIRILWFPAAKTSVRKEKLSNENVKKIYNNHMKDIQLVKYRVKT